MREPTRKDLLVEVARLRAENERLTRLVATQRPELRRLRDIEVGLRDYLTNGARTLERLHAECQALLPGYDDLPQLAELHGILGEGKARVDAALSIQHGITCEKRPHTESGYLHVEDDDSSYDVDHVRYCGRCHQAI